MSSDAAALELENQRSRYVESDSPVESSEASPRAYDDVMMFPVQADVQPELWVNDKATAAADYERAFGAVVEHDA